MSYILHIETSTNICSVAVSQSAGVLAYKTVSDRNVHSEMLTIFIEEIMKEAGISINDLEAVSVSKGPGSFTGLRIGVAVAKGICFGKNIPFIGVNTLQSLITAVPDPYKNSEYLFFSIIDARNGEAYHATYDHLYQEQSEVKIGHIQQEDVEKYLKENKLVFIGDEVRKWAAGYEEQENVILLTDVLPDARNLVPLAFDKFQSKEFEDITFFEPLYLRDFKAKIGTRIKNILNS